MKNHLDELKMPNIPLNYINRFLFQFPGGKAPALVIWLVIWNAAALAIGPNFDYYSKVKFEYQYSDYLEYGWPAAVEYAFSEHLYQQPNPLLASFPEHRWLTKVTQAFGPSLEIQLMYHYSFLGKNYFINADGSRSEWNKSEHLYNSLLNYKLKDNLSLNGTVQYSLATGNQLSSYSAETADLTGWMFDMGFDWDFAGFVRLEPSLSFFWNEVGGTKTNAQSLNFKFRQALSNTTALQVKYSYFHTDAIGNQPGLQYQTITGWLSQWLPTQTAVHLIYRHHADNQNGVSNGPGIEISQYLDWATVMTLSYRNYKMTNDDPQSNFRQTINGDTFTSDAYSLILSRTFWNDTVIAVKYRYYTTNQKVRMNTYLISWEQVF